MTVAELRQRMTQREWLAWSSYYARQEQRRELEEERAKRRGGRW